MCKLSSVVAAVFTLMMILVGSRLLAQVTVFDNQTEFVDATGAEVVLIPTSDSEFPITSCGSGGEEPTGQGPEVTMGFDSNMITVKGLISPLVCIFDAGYLSFNTVPINSGCGDIDGCDTIFPQPANLITMSGDDDFNITFDQPIHAFGFQLVTNGAADETVTLYEGEFTTVIGAGPIDIDALTNPDTRQFVGFKSVTPIKSVTVATETF